MSKLVEAIESEALALSLEERKRLALLLLESIELRPVSDPKKVEAAWVAESKRRYEAYLRGEERAFRNWKPCLLLDNTGWKPMLPPFYFR